MPNYETKDYIVRKYHVVFCDEYNNWFFLGDYDNLRDAEPDLNDYLKDMEMLCYDDEGNELPCQTPKFGEGENLGVLHAVPGTFGYTFDVEIPTTCGGCRVGGYIDYKVNWPKLLRDIAGKGKKAAYDLDDLATAETAPIVKSMLLKDAYQRFGAIDAYENLAEVLEKADKDKASFEEIAVQLSDLFEEDCPDEDA